MAYMHIDNLYKHQAILMWRECYAMEKIHGTSAHVGWKDGRVRFFSGGARHELFADLFDEAALTAAFTQLGHDEVVVFGEAYGGKMQGMRETYGDALRFVAFEVKIGQSWLNVPVAEQVATDLGFEFVHYVRIPTDMQAINAERDAPSVQAKRNGCGDGKQREGIVLRPIVEVRLNNGQRVIAKHKADDFRETRTRREVTDPENLRVLTKAKAIAEEWVTHMRLSHVLGQFGPEVGKEQTGDVIKAMFADIEREAEGEVVLGKASKKAIGSRAAQMFHARLQEQLVSGKP